MGEKNQESSAAHAKLTAEREALKLKVHRGTALGSHEVSKGKRKEKEEERKRKKERGRKKERTEGRKKEKKKGRQEGRKEGRKT